jgi:hypothetical protein
MSLNCKILGAAAVGILTGPIASAEVPRGPDIEPRAAGCNIGPFGQVWKAGEYNALCNIMSDSEKCLALIKGHFDETGAIQTGSESDRERLKYCMETLTRELGVISE